MSKPKAKKDKPDGPFLKAARRGLVRIARQGLERRMKALTNERDALRQLRDDIDDLISSCDDAKEGLDTAIEALSRYV